jgi:hypothetical protein
VADYRPCPGNAVATRDGESSHLIARSAKREEASDGKGKAKSCVTVIINVLCDIRVRSSALLLLI